MTKKVTHTQNNAAFSLIEVLCAILILGLGMVGLTRGLTTALGSSKESELQTAASLLAAGRIETLRAEGYLSDGVETGEGGEGLSLYHWEQTVSKTEIDGLHHVRVEVQHAKSHQTIYELQTLIFDPPLLPSTDESKTRGKSEDARRRDRRNR